MNTTCALCRETLLTQMVRKEKAVVVLHSVGYTNAMIKVAVGYKNITSVESIIKKHGKENNRAV
jgi:uncharacterized membrane protein